MASARLTPLANMEALSPLVYRILGCNPGPMTLQGTNTYVVGRGPKKILIDTGEPAIPQYVQNLAAVLKQMGAGIDRIICTHWHEDHVGGVPDVLAALKKTDGNADPAVHKLRRSDNRQESFNYQYIEDGQVFRTDGVTLRVLYTPGHTDDHICLYLEEENAIFSGDCVLGEGTAVFENLRSYMQSLQNLAGMKPSVIYPGHGPVINDGVDRIKMYISHRIQREEQILKTLDAAGRPLSPIEIVKLVYKDIAENLLIAAVTNVNHHLSKLEQDGKIVLKMLNDGCRVLKPQFQKKRARKSVISSTDSDRQSEINSLSNVFHYGDLAENALLVTVNNASSVLALDKVNS